MAVNNPANEPFRHGRGAAALSEGTGARNKRRPVTWGAVLLGLALIPLNAYWVTTAELRWYMILTLSPLFVPPVFILGTLAAANAAARRLAPSATFSTGELLTVYVMVAVSCTVATLDYSVNWIRMIGWGAWFETPENRWLDLVFPHVPKWSLVWDRSALRGLFEGGNLYAPEMLRVWAGPFAAWMGFMLLSFGVMLCLTSLVRRAWIEETKLSFPIVRLPLALAGVGAPGLLRSPLLWLGAAFPLVNGTLSGLAQIWPGVPHLQTSARFPQVKDPPLSLIGWTPVALYPFAIGLAYFVPLDVLFSCWFFYVFGKLQLIAGHYLGVGQVPGYPFQSEQAVGAWWTYAGLLLYITRHHWRSILSRGRGARVLAQGELLSPATALVVGALLLVGLLGFWRVVGMGWLTSILAVGSYLLVSLAITRLRAETGAPHDVVSPEPMNLFNLVDTRLLTKGDIVGAGLNHWFWRFNRSHAMPTQLEALKLWHDAGLRPRDLAAPLVLATVVSPAAALWAALHIGYRDGALTKCIGFKPMTGTEMWNWMAQMMSGGHGTDAPRVLAVLAGAGLVLSLRAAQARLSWLWFHPLGYCVGPSLNWVWFPFLVAWLLKFAVVRYGGEKGYRRLIPLFLGLVLGDYLTAAGWALVSPALGRQGYHIFH